MIARSFPGDARGQAFSADDASGVVVGHASLLLAQGNKSSALRQSISHKMCPSGGGMQVG
jgi:hypothetical protein